MAFLVSKNNYKISLMVTDQHKALLSEGERFSPTPATETSISCHSDFIVPKKSVSPRPTLGPPPVVQNYYALIEPIDDEPLPYLDSFLMQKIFEYVPSDDYVSSPSTVCDYPSHGVTRYENGFVVYKIGNGGRRRRMRWLDSHINLPIEIQCHGDGPIASINTYLGCVFNDIIAVELPHSSGIPQELYDIDTTDSVRFWFIDYFDAREHIFQSGITRNKPNKKKRTKKKLKPWRKPKPQPIESYDELVARECVQGDNIPSDWQVPEEGTLRKDDFEEMLSRFAKMQSGKTVIERITGFQDDDDYVVPFSDPLFCDDDDGTVVTSNLKSVDPVRDPPKLVNNSVSVEAKPPDIRNVSNEKYLKLLDHITKVKGTVEHPNIYKPLISTLENVILVGYQVYRSYTHMDDMFITDLVASFILFIKLEFKEDSLLMSLVDSFKEYVLGLKVPDRMQVGFCTGVRDQFRNFRYHPASRHIMALISLCITVGFISPRSFSFAGYTVYEAEAWDRSASCVDMFDAILTSVGYLFDRAHECFKEGSLRPLMQATTDEAKFRSGVSYVRSTIESVVQGNYESLFSKTEPEWATLLDDLIIQANVIAPSFAYTRRDIENDKLQLQNVKCRYDIYKRSSGMREAPYALAFYGRSGVGKSTAQSIVLKSLMAYNGLPHDDHYICNLNVAEKFQSGLRSNIISIVMDDYANARVPVSTSSEGVWTIQFVNNVKSTAIMAEASEKGNISVEPKFVSITTNTKGLNAKELSNCPESIIRRFKTYITVNVKPEFQQSGSHALDSSKVEDKFGKPGVVDDIWLFTVEAPQFANEIHKMPTFSPVFFKGKPMVDVDVYTLVRYLNIETKLHFKSQQLLVAKSKHFDKHIPLCPTCRALVGTCDCVSDESGYTMQSGIFKPDFRITDCTKSSFWINTLYTGSTWASLTAQGMNVLPLVFYEAAAGIYYGFKNGLKDTFETVSHVLCPTLLERHTAVVMDTCSDVLSLRMFENNKLRWLYYALPDSFVLSTPFEKFYGYCQRRENMALFRYCMLPVTCGIGYVETMLLRSNMTPKQKSYGTMGVVSSFLCLSAGAYKFCEWKFQRELHSIRASRDPDYALKILQNDSNTRELRDQLQAGTTGTVDKYRGTLFRVGASIALVGGVVSLIQLFKGIHAMYVSDMVDTQASLDSDDGSHVETRDKKRDIYVTKKTASIGKNASYNTKEFLEMIAHNQRFMRIYASGGKELSAQPFCNCVVVKDNVFLAPRHMFYIDRSMMDEMYEYPIRIELVQHHRVGEDGKPITGSVNRSVKLEKGSIIALGNSDLVVFYANTGPVRDLTRFMSDDKYSGVYDTLYRNSDGRLVTNTGTCSPRAVPYKLSRGKVSWSYEAMNTHNALEWNDGHCMTTIVADGPPRIVGFHLMGIPSVGGVKESRYGVAICAPTDILKDAMTMLEQNCCYSFHGATYVPEQVMGIDIHLNFNCKESPFHYINQHVKYPCFEFYGNCDGGVTSKSAIRESIIANSVTKYIGVDNVWGPPQFAPGGKKYIPWETGLKAMCDPCLVTNYNVLSWAKRDYIRPLIPALGIYCSKETNVIRPLTPREIINGVSGLRFIDAINFKTSMGFPIRKKKSEHMHELVDDIGSYKDFVDPKYWQAVAQWEHAIVNSLPCQHHIFSTFLKDETLPKQGSDGKPKKVRLVQSAPILLQLLVRKYYLPILRFMCVHPLKTECAVGINAAGPEWQEVHDKICEVTCSTDGNPSMVAGDFSCWDQRMPGNLTQVSLSIMIDLARISGNYTEDDIVVMRALARELAYPLVNYNGSLVRFLGLMCSGNNLTAVLNSLNNSLLQRYIFRILCHENLQDLSFRDCVFLLTYGDDFISAVQDDILPWYNHISVASTLRRETGMVMTMPDKKADPLPSLPLYETDFLKRTFTLVPGLEKEGKEYHIGKLSLDSIHKSLMCTDALKCNERNVLSQTMCNQMVELFFHGPGVYEKYRTAFSNIANECSIPFTFGNITYEQRVEKWVDYHLNPLTTLTHEQFMGYEDEHFPDDTDFDFMSGCLYTDCAVLITDLSAYNNALLYNPLYGRVASGCLLILICPGWHYWTIVACNGFCMQPNILPTEKEQYLDLIGEGNLHRGMHVACIDNVDSSKHFFQSGNMMSYDTPAALTGFDVTPGGTSTESMVHDATYDIIGEPEVSLEHFLSRPVQISSGTIGTGFDEDIYPLLAFCLNPRISNRINNYSWLNGTMCVKVMVNGAANYYGKLIMAVDYYPNQDSTMMLFNGPTLTHLTQMPHIYINPTQGSAGCLEIPLYHHYNAISIDTNTLTSVVTLRFREMNEITTLDPTNISPLNYTVWAWFKDVTLYSPSQSNNNILLPQAGMDEYGSLSTKASLVADAIGKFKTAPIVGDYARASELAVNSMATVMKLFGYSRPSVVPTPQYVVAHTSGVLANYNAPDTSFKLGLDVKNEVTVDPRVVGMTEDEMSLVYISNKSCRVYDDIWAAGSSQLMAWNVTPTIGKNAGMITLIPPMTHAAMPFKYWRGTIAYTIEVVASAFHKGKLRIVHDPSSTLEVSSTSWVTDTNLNNAYVMDIAEEREYTFYVGWTSNKSFLRTVPPINQFSSGAALPGDLNNDFTNGRIGIHALVPLFSTAGVATPPAYINIYARACPDFEVAVPTCDNIDNFSYNEPKADPEDNYRFQSGVIEETPGGLDVGDESNAKQVQLTDTTNVSRDITDELLLIHMGERITSARQLVKRYCPEMMIYVYTLCNGTNGVAGGLNWAYLNMPDFPLYSGWSALGTPWWFSEAGAKYKIYTTPCNWLTWFTPAYVMRRGALRSKYMKNDTCSDVNSSSNVVNSWAVSLLSTFTTGLARYARGISAANITSDAGNYYASFGDTGPPCGFCGSATIDTTVANTLTVECPFQTNMRYRYGQNRRVHQPLLDGDINDPGMHRLWVTVYNWTNAGAMWKYIRRYTAAGDDYSLHCYKHTPPLVNEVFTAP